MAHIFKPPTHIVWGNSPSVFLAGTIDNGDSHDWQNEVELALAHLNVNLLNPRRDEWDSTWEQSIDNPLFREQVEWELDGLDKCTYIFIYFAAGSKSPISLLELGLHASANKVVIVCPKGFWRRGNIEVVANKYGIPLFENIADGLDLLKDKLT